MPVFDHLVFDTTVFDTDPAGSGQTLSPTGIASVGAFGTAQLNLTLYPDGIASAEAFGTPAMGGVLKPEAIDSEEAFGTPNLLIVITPLSCFDESVVSAPIFVGDPANFNKIRPTGFQDSGFGVPQIVNNGTTAYGVTRRLDVCSGAIETALCALTECS